MKLISFTANGESGFGAVRDEGVIALSGRMDYPDLRSLIAANAIGEAAKLAATLEADFALETISLLPPITNPGKIICVGLNYHAHVAETGRALTEKPALFARYPESQIGHLQPMVKPLESDQLDFEGELAVVIGKPGRRIRESEAADHIAGYACYNDGSIRDWQYHTTQFLSGKTFVGTGAFGPWMVTADEVPDLSRRRLTTRLNGVVMQSATIDMMITPIAAQIAYISTFVPLSASDVIVTGTPGGVGAKRKPPIFMKEGDVVEVEIDGVGLLRNTVVNEDNVGKHDRGHWRQ